MIQKVISEFYDDESQQYFYIVRITIFGLLIYARQFSSSRRDLLGQFINREIKVGFRNESKN